MPWKQNRKGYVMVDPYSKQRRHMLIILLSDEIFGVEDLLFATLWGGAWDYIKGGSNLAYFGQREPADTSLSRIKAHHVDLASGF